MVEYILGKIAVITGGSTGIGAACIKKFFKNGLTGCSILDVDESGAALAQEMNCRYGYNKALFFKADVRDKCAFERALKETIKRHRKIDLLINNAAIGKDRIWETMTDINVKGTVISTLLGIKYMGKNNCYYGGTIVNTSSVLGLEPLSGLPCYTGTKHFVVGLNRCFSTQYWYDLTGIRFLTFCPGITSMVGSAEDYVLEGFPNLKQFLEKDLKREKLQSSERLAEGMMTMLNEGKNGSIWVSWREQPVFEVELPSINQMSHSGKCHFKAK
ncbi:15-hydroxyprostaglandin dehydrogenase [NAD(+)]-like [Anthonomus grandis grandis]|uniref:15-hydroxyprostaglandin dehydrogenase [NAD(+)]-like n=1 Tax=Anthonomus grandis grandis TaxID=2921223 RepID=UPI0021665BF0|nr:15-hydroxyprostaglandin dehydrogenase [NAD(+)]-like [Anthonomus grandis grandis]